MENPWNSLTPRHKRYAAICCVLGTLLGMGIGLMALLIAGAIIGSIATGAGITVLYKKKDEWENSDTAYTYWMTVGLCGIIGGLTCFAGAILGLILHQNGVL